MTSLSMGLARLKTPALLITTVIALVYAWQVEHRSSGGLPPHAEAVTPKLQPAVQGGIVAEARLVTYPGEQVIVGTDYSGTIETLAVQELAVVQKGQLLATIKAQDLRAELTHAEAQLAEIDTDISFYTKEFNRAENLFKSNAFSKQDLERIEHRVHNSRARRATAKAGINRIKAILSKTTITAPINGTVIMTHAEVGETLLAGSSILTLANLSKTRVEAELDEFDFANVKIGDSATISAEGTTTTWQGRVEEIPSTVSQRRIKPQDPSRPTDARVLLVKIALDEPTPLKLGQRLEVRIRPGP